MAVLALASALGACVTSTATTCADGTVCAAGQVCLAGGGCADETQAAACDGLDEGSTCTLAGIGAGACRGGACVVTACGDTILDVGEQCDDGNDIDDDDCTNACRLPACGDGAVQGDEACDDGAANGDDRACTSACAAAACGDGLVQAGVEACDLGAGNSDDGACTTTCEAATCGDGLVRLGVEGCDDGNGVDDDACRNGCTLPSCGDGVVQAGEACDDGAGNSDDRACTASCQAAACGDGKQHLGAEACDLGAGNSDGGACTTTCEAATCGDGLVRLGVEGCDDGNAVDDDGCRTSCALPSCGDGVVQAGEACDDGAGNGDDRACTASCQSATCGDGKLHLGQEACDAGVANTNEGACTTSCEAATCGDGHVWSVVEACDDGNATSGDGCRADCRKAEACGDGAVDLGEACDDGAEGLPNPADGCDACVATEWLAQAVVGAEQLGPDVGLSRPMGVAVDRTGNLYIADTDSHRVRKVAAGSGVATVVAGTGAPGYAGDSSGATSAQLNSPSGVAIDGAGNVYIADAGNYRVRKVAAGSGVITTVAGTGSSGYSGDGGPGSGAQLSFAADVTVDGAGNVYIADTGNFRVRKVAAGSGVITTVAGTGTAGFSGDAGPAVAAQLLSPRGLAADEAGNVYVVDAVFFGGGSRIRKVTAETGIITTIAGSGTSGYAGDGGPATSAQLQYCQGVAVDGAGNVFIADTLTQRIRKVTAATGIITTIAGTGTSSYSGDDGPATNARLNSPEGVAVDGTGNVYVADTGNQRIRKVASATGIISTVAGGGGSGIGDGGAATNARLTGSSRVAVDGEGHLYVAEAQAVPFSLGRIRKVAAGSRIISAVAGTGTTGYAGDGGPAVSARLSAQLAVAVDSAGDVYIADAGNHRIRKVVEGTGIIATFAGTGTPGFSGDDGPAASAQVSSPAGVAVDGAGNVYLADTGNHRVRRVDFATGVISTFAGGGAAGLGDDGPAVSAQLSSPRDVAVDTAGNVYIADIGNSRVRKVAAGSGIITTVAASASANSVAVNGAGDVYFLGGSFPFVYKVSAATGLRTIAAGSGVCCTVDGGPATGSAVAISGGVAADAAGNLFIAEPSPGGDGRIRKVAAATGIITTVAGPIDPAGVGPVALARLADPRGLALTPDMTLIAGGATGTVEALRTLSQRLDAVIGRYPQPTPTGDLARFRDTSFGDVGGVAYDAGAGRIYLSETTRHRVRVVTPVDPTDAGTWTIATLAGAVAGLGTAGFADGAALAARFDAPAGLFFDEDARVLYVADAGNHVIRAMPVDLAGQAGAVTTVAGTARTLGYFGDDGAATDALLYLPQAITRCGNGDLFIADTANHRVRRVAEGSGVITTVLGDGVAASSGQGSPARTFPVDAPQGLACDDFGNLFVSSRTTVRAVMADASGTVDGGGAVQTIYGAPPRDAYPASVTSCLTGVSVIDAATVWATDSCAGVLVELWRQPAT